MLRNFLLAAGLLTVAGVASAGDPGAGATHAFSATERATRTGSMRLVYGLLTDPRYSIHGRKLDATIEAATFAAYLDQLDAQRLFLDDADVRKLDAARAGIGDVIQAHDLAPMFTVFDAFVARVDERTAFARARLAEPADYETAGTWVPDRSAQPRPADAAALDELWRRLVRNDRLELHLAGQSDEAIRRTLDARYADLARRAHALRPDEIFSAFVNAFATTMDPGAGYYAPLDRMATFAIDPSLVGVGMVVKHEGPFVVVQSVVPGGPAAKGDVYPGDRILAIGSGESGEWTDVVGARIDNVVEGMRGKPGTVSRLRLGSPAGAQRDVALTRARIQLADEVATRSLVTTGDRRIGVITLPAFYMDFAAAQRGDPDARSSVSDVRRLLRELQAEHADGVLLDLRGNGGGSLLESVEMAALFVGRAPVVQVRESGGRVSVESGSADAAWAGPVAVLVDEQSAAASEILAAALQDHGRGLVLGARTFGRGSVQNLIDLGRVPIRNGDQYGKVKITIAEFFRADGRSIEGVGVEPDVALPDARAAAPRAGMRAEGKRIAPAPGFSAAVAKPAAPDSKLESDPAYRAWRERWLRARDIAAANALALDAPTRRVAMARERQDVDAARAHDDGLQAAVGVFAGGLPASGEGGGR